MKMKILEVFLGSKQNRWRKMASAECPLCHGVIYKHYDNLIRQKTCGCHIPTGEERTSYKHGKEPNLLYQKWKSMRKRCNDPSEKAYKDYGGRGIRVCQEWEESFIPFRDWSLENGWSPELTIDRIDNDGPYSPENCRYSTNAVQQQHKRNSKLDWNKVKRIRELLAQGIPGQRIAKMFSVSSTMIYMIRDGKTWK